MSTFYLPIMTKNSILSKYDVQILKEKSISHLKEMKLEGNLILNDYSNNQIYFFHHLDYLIIGGYFDNSFKIFKENQEIKTDFPKMHNNLITCIAVSEKYNIIMTGSKDCRIVVWFYDLKKNFLIEKTHILYGHNCEVIGLEINESLNIIVSLDKDGYLMTHSLHSLKCIKGIYIDKEEKEVVEDIKIHSNGLILLKSKRSLMLYK